MLNPSGCMGQIWAGSLGDTPEISHSREWYVLSSTLRHEVWTLLNIQKVWMKLPELGIFLSDYANLQLCGLEVHVQDRGQAWDRQLKISEYDKLKQIKFVPLLMSCV